MFYPQARPAARGSPSSIHRLPPRRSDSPAGDPSLRDQRSWTCRAMEADLFMRKTRARVLRRVVASAALVAATGALAAPAALADERDPSASVQGGTALDLAAGSDS